MHQKLFFSLSFIFLAILITAGSCGGGGPTPKAVMSDITPNPLTLVPFPAEIGAEQQPSGSFSFSNTGDATLNYTVKFTVGDEVNGSLEPGQSKTVNPGVECTEVGSGEEDLQITSNGGDKTVKLLWECKEKTIPTGDYNIQLIPIGADMTEERQDVFEAAIGLWKAAIIGDLPDVPVAEGELPENSACAFETPAFVGTIDDLLIFATISPIDGVGGILGQAGPTFNRSIADSELSIIGCMQFDTADVEALEANGTFNEVILHEMGHVLGIGTFWEPIQLSNGSFFNSRNLLDTPCRTAPGATAGFNGANTVIEFGTLGRSGNAPVENEGGDGTRCSHWDEEFFDNELMTGFLGGVTSSTVNPLSRLTIASLEDLGYEVDYTEAEPYSIPGCSPTCGVLRISATETPWEVLVTPKGYIGKDGKINYFDQQR